MGNKASIVLLNYNSGELIYRAIKSILAQNYKNLELIISDDCSKDFDKDKIVEIINQGMANSLSYQILQNTENLGTVKNYNNAIKHSSGDYIINLAADDAFATPQTVEEIVNCFERTHAEVVVSKASTFDKQAVKNIPQHFFSHFLTEKDYKKLLSMEMLQNHVSGAIISYSKNTLIQYNGFDERYRLIEDWPIILKLLKDKRKIYFNDKLTVLYNVGGVSTVKKKPEIYLQDYVNIINNEIITYKGISKFQKRYCQFMIERINCWLCNRKAPAYVYLHFIDVICYKGIASVMGNKYVNK